jgi:hypothetical protein
MSKPTLIKGASGVFAIERVYYWNCRLNSMTAMLAGPFASPELAQECAEIVSPVCVQYRPETRNASFGVVEVKAPGNGPGVYNEILPPKLMGELLASIEVPN